MPLRTALASSIVLTAALALGPGTATAQPKSRTSPAEVGLSPMFRSGSAELTDATIHYVMGGSGPAVILVHGFPQDWSEWRHIMPDLADRFTVVAVDLRGIGESKTSSDSYDAKTLAADLRDLARGLGLERPYIAGHDIGGLAAYAFARAYPDDTRGVMVLDVPLPGIGPWEQVRREPFLWHFHFHQTPDLPEMLVHGREEEYFRDFVDRLGGNPSAFSDDDIHRYAKAHQGPGGLNAAFGFFRAFPQIAEWNKAQTTPTDVPIVLAAGEKATASLLEPMAADLRQKGARNVTTEVIADSGHYVVDEQPARIAELIRKYAG